MTQAVFLQQLRQALENDLKGNVVQENVNYYSQYITDEINKGREEAEVLQMLGDPWILAKTVIDAQGGTDESATRQGAGAYGGRKKDDNVQKEERRQTVFPRFDTWWKKILLIGSIILIVMIIFSLITGVIGLLSRFIVPVLMIILVRRLLKNRRM